MIPRSSRIGRVLGLVADALMEPDPGVACSAVGEILLDNLIGADLLVACTFDGVTWRHDFVQRPGEGVVFAPKRQISPATARTILSQRTLAYTYAEGKLREVRRASDVHSRAAWQRTASYAFMAEQLGVRWPLVIPLLGASAPRLVVLNRARRDFTDANVGDARDAQRFLSVVDNHLRLRVCGRPAFDVAQDLQDSARLAREAARAARVAASAHRAGGLTMRELQAVAGIAEGLSVRETAARLGISPRTVDKHLENVYKKIGVRNQVSMVLRARELGLLPPDVM